MGRSWADWAEFIETRSAVRKNCNTAIIGGRNEIRFRKKRWLLCREKQGYVYLLQQQLTVSEAPGAAQLIAHGQGTSHYTDNINTSS